MENLSPELGLGLSLLLTQSGSETKVRLAKAGGTAPGGDDMADDLTDEARERLARGMEPVPEERADREVIIRHFVDDYARHFPERRERMLEWVDATMARLMNDAPPGDELWICRSRFIGPLAGHRGLGVVRAGKVVKYETVINY